MTGPERDGGQPTQKRTSRLGENAFIGCLYLAVGVAAMALFLMFGQLIFRMFFM
jgi:hypothetical protein